MTDTDRELIRLAATHYRYPAVRDQAIEALGMSPVRGYQRVVWLLGTPEAEREMPVEVRRLRRLVEGRRVTRNTPACRR